jgi:hypothetical protein
MFVFDTSGDERGWSLDKVSSSICCTCSLTSETGYSCAVKSLDSYSGSTMSLFEYAAADRDPTSKERTRGESTRVNLVEIIQ